MNNITNNTHFWEQDKHLSRVINKKLKSTAEQWALKRKKHNTFWHCGKSLDIDSESERITKKLILSGLVVWAGPCLIAGRLSEECQENRELIQLLLTALPLLWK